MNKKTVCGALFCVVVLLVTSLKPDKMDQFAAALASIATTEKTTTMERFLSPVERQKRIADLRKKLKDNVVMSSQEARDVMVQYLLDRSVEVFQGFANILGDAVQKTGSPNAQAAGETVKRLPATFAAGFFLTYSLMREIATPAYLEHLNAIRKPLNCLLKPGERTGAKCEEYRTVKAALDGVFQNLKPFLLPFAKAMFLGVEVTETDGSRGKINGWVPLGIGVVAPGSAVEKDVHVIVELVNIILNFSDQFKELTAEPSKKVSKELVEA